MPCMTDAVRVGGGEDRGLAPPGGVCRGWGRCAHQCRCARRSASRWAAGHSFARAGMMGFAVLRSTGSIRTGATLPPQASNEEPSAESPGRTTSKAAGSGTTSIFRVSPVERGASELENGFNPALFPRTAELDGSAHFGNQARVEDFAAQPCRYTRRRPQGGSPERVAPTPRHRALGGNDSGSGRARNSA